MKVFIINAIYGSRSSGRSVAEIEQFLLDNGHQVCVAAPFIEPTETHFIIGNSIDHKAHAFLSRLSGLQAYFSHSATSKLISQIDKFSPDIVHIQVIHGNFINFPMLMDYLSKKKIRTVFVLDDCWYFTGKCCHYIGVPCDRWKHECGSCPRVKMDNPSWLFDFSAKMLRDKRNAFSKLDKYAVVTVSKWLEKEVSQSYLNSAGLLTTIYNSIDVENFAPRKDTEKLRDSLGIKNEHVVLGVATAWADSVGLSKGLDLFAELSEKLPDDYRIVLVGKMDENKKLPDKIIPVEFVDGAKELSYYYSMADVFVQMSAIETFGKVTAEALSCATPVIVFNSTANPELVGENCGYVVEKGNVDEVCSKVIEIVDNGKYKYSESCRRFAVENFEKNSNAAKYLNLYNSLLDLE